jgi:hypothetical protein
MQIISIRTKIVKPIGLREVTESTAKPQMRQKTLRGNVHSIHALEILMPVAFRHKAKYKGILPVESHKKLSMLF